jgi:hypothetical protein
MSKLAKLVALSLAISQGSAIPRRGNKSDEYFKEMDRQLAETKKIKNNSEIRQAISVLKRFRQKYKSRRLSISRRRSSRRSSRY